MQIVDVILLEGRKRLVQLFAVDDIPENVGFGRYYDARCEIALKGGETISLQCAVHRPIDRRNVVGERQVSWLVLLIETDLAPAQFSEANISVVRYGRELNEAEARNAFGLSA